MGKKTDLGKQIAGQAESIQQPADSENGANGANEFIGVSGVYGVLEQLPCFSPKIKQLLTPFLRTIIEADDTETMQDLLLLSSLNSGLCPARERGSVFITDLAVRFLVEQLK